DASPEVIRTLARFYAEHGVTSFLATTWTASGERIQAALENIAACAGPQPNGATLLGAHLEGPYLNPARCGAQDSQQIRRAELNEAKSFLDTGAIRLLALAPEYEENHWLIEECVQRGITVSAAHTAATYEDMQRAVGMGLSHSTHTFNAMTGLNHRSPGTVGAVLSMPEIACELIADTVHVHPAVMKILVAAKGMSGTILITDAVRGAGLPVGSQYEQDGRPITVGDNSVCLPDGTLAGSKLTMELGVRNLKAALGQPLETVWPAASLNAARAIRIDERKGSLEPGKDADIVLVDETVTVRMTIAEGTTVYSQSH
ncbi:MAG: N-acetylglucosamine-6-phosphate deacetylase, partial [Anaerolineae bacterium]|nr:N-acetylglucosamine-6-phosphate deacetylase [Anaerolineae bacterium]